MQRVLVAGGAGLIGSHLVDRILDAGDEVIAVDDLSRGSFANVAHLKREPRFAFVEHDLTWPFRAEVTRIFHLAIPSTQGSFELDPVKATMTCVAGTLNALEAAAANGAPLVLVTSTERFGEGVRCAESLAIEFAKRCRVEVRIVRTPTAYGPRMPPDADDVVSSLILQALRGDSLVASTGLDRVMRLTYVDDAVETIMRTMDSDLHVAPVPAPFQQATVGEIANLVADLAGQWQNALPATMAGVGAATDLADGLQRTLAWFAQRIAVGPRTRSSGVFSNGRSAAPDRARSGT